jgi:DNA-binding transcriptional ArsR family regulator
MESTHARARVKKNVRAAEGGLDQVFHALSDQTRRALLARLAQGPAMVSELARPFAMSLPAVSKHVRVLEAAQLVVRRVEGRVHWCSLAPSPLESAQTWIEGYRSFWEGALDALSRYVESDQPRSTAGKRRRAP